MTCFEKQDWSWWNIEQCVTIWPVGRVLSSFSRCESLWFYMKLSNKMFFSLFKHLCLQLFIVFVIAVCMQLLHIHWYYDWNSLYFSLLIILKCFVRFLLIMDDLACLFLPVDLYFSFLTWMCFINSLHCCLSCRDGYNDFNTFYMQVSISFSCHQLDALLQDSLASYV